MSFCACNKKTALHIQIPIYVYRPCLSGREPPGRTIPRRLRATAQFRSSFDSRRVPVCTSARMATSFSSGGGNRPSRGRALPCAYSAALLSCGRLVALQRGYHEQPQKCPPCLAARITIVVPQAGHAGALCAPAVGGMYPSSGFCSRMYPCGNPGGSCGGTGPAGGGGASGAGTAGR